MYEETKNIITLWRSVTTIVKVQFEMGENLSINSTIWYGKEVQLGEELPHIN